MILLTLCSLTLASCQNNPSSSAVTPGPSSPGYSALSVRMADTKAWLIEQTDCVVCAEVAETGDRTMIAVNDVLRGEQLVGQTVAITAAEGGETLAAGSKWVLFLRKTNDGYAVVSKDGQYRIGEQEAIHSQSDRSKSFFGELTSLADMRDMLAHIDAEIQREDREKLIAYTPYIVTVEVEQTETKALKDRLDENGELADGSETVETHLATVRIQEALKGSLKPQEQIVIAQVLQDEYLQTGETWMLFLQESRYPDAHYYQIVSAAGQGKIDESGTVIAQNNASIEMFGDWNTVSHFKEQLTEWTATTTTAAAGRTTTI